MWYNEIGGNMNIKIEQADKKDIDRILEIKLEIWELLENKDLYEMAGITKEFLLKQLDNDGLLLKCMDEDKIMGFTIIKRNIKPDSPILSNLQHDDIEEWIEMSNMGVLPKYRGMHLQQKMIQEAEKIMKRRFNKIKHSIASVHPDNIASLKSFLNNNYKIVERTKLYGGKDRYILVKEL